MRGLRALGSRAGQSNHAVLGMGTVVGTTTGSTHGSSCSSRHYHGTRIPVVAVVVTTTVRGIPAVAFVVTTTVRAVPVVVVVVTSTGTGMPVVIVTVASHWRSLWS